MGPDLSHGESAVGLLRPEPGTGSLLGGLSWEDESLEPLGTTRDRSLPQYDASGQAGRAGGWRPEAGGARSGPDDGRAWRQIKACVCLEGLGACVLPSPAHPGSPSPPTKVLTDAGKEGSRHRGSNPSTPAVNLSDAEKPKKSRAKTDTPATSPGSHPHGLHHRDGACHVPGAEPCSASRSCCDDHHGAVTT